MQPISLLQCQEVWRCLPWRGCADRLLARAPRLLEELLRPNQSATAWDPQCEEAVSMPSSIGLDMAETVDQPLPRTARSPRRRRASMPLFLLMKFQA